MRLLLIPVILFLMMLPILTVPDVDAEPSVTEEYWCGGDHVVMSFGSDSANVSWTVTDALGNVLKQADGETLEMTVSDRDAIFVTQTIETAQGKSVKTVKVNLLHLNGQSYSAVFYDSEGGNTVAERHLNGSSVCRNGVFIEVPEVPEAPKGKVFGGWYQRSGDSLSEYDPAVPLSEDIQIFATWLQTYKVTFVSESGYIDSETVIEGQTVALPEVEPVPGKVFCGWHTDSKCRNAYSAGEPVEDNLVLYAKWALPEEEKGDLGPMFWIPVGLLSVLILGGYMRMRGRSNGGSGGRYR